MFVSWKKALRAVCKKKNLKNKLCYHQHTNWAPTSILHTTAGLCNTTKMIRNRSQGAEPCPQSPCPHRRALCTAAPTSPSMDSRLPSACTGAGSNHAYLGSPCSLLRSSHCWSGPQQAFHNSQRCSATAVCRKRTEANSKPSRGSPAGTG